MANITENLGYDTPFIRVYYDDTAQGIICLTDLYPAEKLSYVYDEDGPDTAMVSFRSTVNTGISDHPAFRKNAQLRVVWGYMARSQATRMVWVKDTKWEYTKEGIKLTVEAEDKSSRLNNTRSFKVHKGSNALGVANSIAKKHGLHAKISYEDQRQELLQQTLRKPGEPIEVWRARFNNANNKLAYLKHTKNEISLQQALEPMEQQFKKLQKTRLDNTAVNKKDYASTPMITDKQSLDEAKKIINNIRKNPDQYNQAELTAIAADIAPAIRYLYGPNADMQALLDMKDVPQANKTDKQIIEERLKQLPAGAGGPVIMDTRDDTLIIKRRNFSKTPHRAYTWNGGIGELFSFTPETKNLSGAGKAISGIASSWENALKSFQSMYNHQSEELKALREKLMSQYFTKASGNPSTSVIDYNKVSQKEPTFWQKAFGTGYGLSVLSWTNILGVNYKQEPIKDQDGKISGYRWVPDERSIPGLNPDMFDREAQIINENWEKMHPTLQQSAAQALEDENIPEETILYYTYQNREDGTMQSKQDEQLLANQIKREKIQAGFKEYYFTPVTEKDFQDRGYELVPITKFMLNDMHRRGIPFEDGTTNNIHDPNGIDEAANRVGGATSEGQNKTNPAQALVYGDTAIEVGQVFTILNVGKNNSGNYYAKKSTHTVESQGAGYMVSIELMRSGQNMKTHDNLQSIKAADKAINKQLGVDKTTQRTKDLKTNSNPIR